jgi:hypothetical protein
LPAKIPVTRGGGNCAQNTAVLVVQGTQGTLGTQGTSGTLPNCQNQVSQNLAASGTRDVLAKVPPAEWYADASGSINLLNTSAAPDGNFDGLIYAHNLPHENYLDRMLNVIGFGTVGRNGFEKFDNFRTLLYKTFFECCKGKRKNSFNEEIARKINEEIIHRLAFAVTMEIPQFKDFIDYQVFIADCRNQSTEKVRIWVPLLQKLRQIYHIHGWGWQCKLYNTNESWLIESIRKEPRHELFVVHQRNLKKLREQIQQEQYESNQSDPLNPSPITANCTPTNNDYQRPKIIAHYEKLESERRKSIGGNPLSTTQAREFSFQFHNIPTEQLAKAYENEINRLIQQRKTLFQ